MSDENKDINELKDEERLKIEIDVEEEAPFTSAKSQTDVVEEFKKLGQNLSNTLQSLLDSDEARRIEGEVRKGLTGFADEVEKFVRDAANSPSAQRLKEDAKEMGKRIESSDVTRQAEEGVVSGLRWMSVELDKLAQRFQEEAHKSARPSPEETVDDIIIEDDEIKSA